MIVNNEISIKRKDRRHVELSMNGKLNLWVCNWTYRYIGEGGIKIGKSLLGRGESGI